MTIHHRFLKSELVRVQEELRDLDVKFCRALLEYRHQGNCDPQLTERPF